MNTLNIQSSPISSGSAQPLLSTENPPPTAVVNETASRAAPPTDTFNLTAPAAQLRSLREDLNKRPVVDEQRVKSMQQALANKTLQVNAGRIADKLLNFERAVAAEPRTHRHV